MYGIGGRVLLEIVEQLLERASGGVFPRERSARRLSDRISESQTRSPPWTLMAHPQNIDNVTLDRDVGITERL